MIRGLIASVLLAAAAPALAAPIAVDGGLVEGVSLPSGVKGWFGVPFAAPPLRELRWQPPQKLVPWQGVYHADRFAPECIQPLRGSLQNHYFGNEATSEDCLYLNIWAPAPQTKKRVQKAPVVVWIYGGAFSIGSASMANYSGEPLARDGVIRVNLAYRVGALGFLAHPALSAEAAYHGSGNYGLMDQIAALQWVRRNIARFGGDSDNVTIVGQSAGSMSVALLQMSPLAKGLFAQAVAMSGSPFGGMLGPAPLARAESEGVALQQALGAANLAEMRALPADRIIAASTPRAPIVLDGHVLNGTAEQVFASGQQNDVPVLIGYTRDESFRPFGAIRTQDDLTQAVRQRFPAQADAMLRAYANADPARAAADIARDTTVGQQMADWAAAQQRYGHQPAYAYQFTRRQPYAPGITFSDHDPATVGAYHTGDVPYWLRTRPALNLFRQTRLWEPVDASLEDAMAGALLAFARGGPPVSPGLGRWPSFDPAHPRLVRLGEQQTVIDWPHFYDIEALSQASVPAAPVSNKIRD